VRRFAVTLAAASFACGGSAPPADPQGAQAAPPPESEAPVALNPDAPIAYPAALFEQNIEGEVVLRLFTDSTGRLIPESTRVVESSNYPALDSAALAGSAKLRFAPAKRHGVPVATAFLQPVDFQHPGSSGPGTSLPPPTATVPAPQRATPIVRPPAPKPQPPAAPTVAPVIRPPADTARPPVDTTRPPPRDTTRSRPDASGPTH
jgi:TonB family protein